ncbi:NPD-domain-containing protein [Hyaloscypha variabilis F]|uniref:NPD-domain-containing protein n=1 Tax=Hyaloscypha variabilis (strain UAMH 11265 / GT02V1 / F) TaxID=1149755 RepID=A0A2J6R850_HYAVF|nr:NPD-domain-containing protein [Hyaloscypha variabilis F]
MTYSHTLTLKTHYPWTSSPLVSSAPMRLIAASPLAAAVSRAGGLGFLGIGTDTSTFLSLLNEAIATFQASPIPNTPGDILPVGVGFICWGANLSMALSVMQSSPLKPAAAWLFAPRETKDLVAWTEEIRKASSGKTKIWVQVGTVTMALDVAKRCKPDVLVIQGSDAGGHGLAQSSSIITLLPECADALAREQFGDIPLIATGGIVDGRGLAAALMLGASGVCLGTRFLASPEAAISEGYRNAVIQTKDGGVNTARTTVYDQLRGTVGWPETYNGRGVLNQSFRDHESGMSEEENKKLYVDATKLGDQGWGSNGRMTTYAGTGVGLIQSVMPAADIVKEVLTESRGVLARAASKL